jgi:hypothetical protein
MSFKKKIKKVPADKLQKIQKVVKKTEAGKK